jgi:mannose/fructose/N-acetylgalactosamine-specific phosphotransferase system component IIC
MNLEPGTIAALIGWGTLVAVDLVSFPQALLARPLVAGAGAGLILGDPALGLRVGLVLELFALDVLPVGASRYPDHGPAAVGAVVLASGGTWTVTLGLAVLFGLTLAAIGGWSLLVLRQSNGRMIQHYSARLAAGDPAAMAAVQYRGLAADLVRGAVLTVAALGSALLLRPWLPGLARYELVSAVAIGAAVAAATSGAIRNAGRGARLRWLAVGAGLGLLLVVLQ